MAQTHCDFLVVGGGAAGCIVARRLAENPSWHVVLVEAGKCDENDPAATDLSRLEEQDESYDWGFHASTSLHSSGQIEYARAKMLGGCANHNDCAFIAPTQGDLAQWAHAGGSGWGDACLSRCLSRIEEQIHIEEAPTGNRLSRAFIDAATDLGLPERNFRRDFGAGAGWFPLNANGALRQSSSICYLHPLSSLPANLQIQTGVSVTALTFEGRRVTGARTSHGDIAAAKEVILCAGSINTPQLMMVSGLGPVDHLRGFGIDVRSDIEGVGQNLMDHVAANVAYQLHEPAPRWDRAPCEATALIKLDENTVDPDVLFHFVLRLREKYVGGDQFADVAHGVKISPNVARPKSRGRVRITGPDINAKPNIQLNYFSDPEGYDKRTLLGGLRWARKLAKTPSLHPFLLREIAPGPDIERDEDLFDYMLQTCETVYHPAGTCKMGPLADHETVVGPNLKVRGLDGLRIADASVFPDMVTVNICNAVMMVAERASEIILEELK